MTIKTSADAEQLQQDLDLFRWLETSQHVANGVKCCCVLCYENSSPDLTNTEGTT